MLQGRAPMPRGSSRPFVIVGVVFYLGVLAVGFGASLFFLAMETTQPTIISEGGIEVGMGPPFYRQKHVAWSEVTKVTCNLPPRENRIRIITIYSHDASVEFGNAGLALEGVRAAILANAPRGTVQPCKHASLNHSWSY
jgi:hypothetical protein